MRTISLCLFSLGLALSLAACGSGNDYVVTGQGPALSADARIQVDPISSGDRRLAVDVEHLLPPDRLGDFSTYSVWVIPPGGHPVMAGRLDYDEDSRRGHIRTVTPFSTFRVIVTAEGEHGYGQPSGAVVIDQEVTS